MQARRLSFMWVRLVAPHRRWCLVAHSGVASCRKLFALSNSFVIFFPKVSASQARVSLMRRNRSSSYESSEMKLKRLKSVCNESADQFICAITLRLPIDPVHAMDGHIYERAAIEAWFAKSRSRSPRSPKTNLPMGRKLLAAPHVKTTIEGLVKSDALTGDSGKTWEEGLKKKLKDDDVVKAMRKKAVEGDSDEMFNMGNMYMSGEHGVKKNTTMACKWLGRSAEAGNTHALDQLSKIVDRDLTPAARPAALAVLGWCTILGKGTKKSKADGIRLLMEGANLRSTYACYLMWCIYAEGKHNISKDSQQAMIWSRKMDRGDNSDDISIEDQQKVIAWRRQQQRERRQRRGINEDATSSEDEDDDSSDTYDYSDTSDYYDSYDSEGSDSSGSGRHPHAENAE